MAGSGFIVVVSVQVTSCVRCSMMAVLAVSDAGQLSQEVHQRLRQTSSRLFIYACSCSGGV